MSSFGGEWEKQFQLSFQENLLEAVLFKYELSISPAVRIRTKHEGACLEVSWDFILMSSECFMKNLFSFSLELESIRCPFPTSSCSQRCLSLLGRPSGSAGRAVHGVFCRSLTYSSTHWFLKATGPPTMSTPNVIPGQTDGSWRKLKSCVTALGAIWNL